VIVNAPNWRPNWRRVDDDDLTPGSRAASVPAVDGHKDVVHVELPGRFKVDRVGTDEGVRIAVARAGYERGPWLVNVMSCWMPLGRFV
jgi:hypothetical protein